MGGRGQGIDRRLRHGGVDLQRPVLVTLQLDDTGLDQPAEQLFFRRDLLAQGLADADIGGHQVALGDGGLGLGAGETRAPKGRQQAEGLGPLGELGPGFREVGEPGVDVGAPQRRRGILDQRRRGEIGVGLGIAARHRPGHAAQAAELGIVQHLRRRPGQVVEHADGFEGQLRADQEPGQRHPRLGRRLVVLGPALDRGRGQQAVVSRQEALFAELGPVFVDQGGHGRRHRRAQGGLLAIAAGPGRRERQARRRGSCAPVRRRGRPQGPRSAALWPGPEWRAAAPAARSRGGWGRPWAGRGR